MNEVVYNKIEADRDRSGKESWVGCWGKTWQVITFVPNRCIDAIMYVYRTVMYAIAVFLRDYISGAIAIGFSVLFLEGVSNVRLGYNELFDSPPKGARVNPTALDVEMSKQNPVLLIHGAACNEGAMAVLAHRLGADGVGPVFTVYADIENGRKNIAAKVDEIRALYAPFGKVPKLDVVGHSRGGVFAEHYLDGECVRKEITLGYAHFGPKEGVETYDFVGKWDVLMPRSSTLKEEFVKTFDCGHNGLLFDAEVASEIAKVLKQETK